MNSGEQCLLVFTILNIFLPGDAYVDLPDRAISNRARVDRVDVVRAVRDGVRRGERD